MNTNVNDNVESANQPSKRPSRSRRWLIRLLLLPVIGYCTIVGLMAAGETFLVYPGSSYPKGDWEPEGFSFEEVEFASADGTKLFGWFLPRHPQDRSQEANPSAEPPKQQTVLFCHGNAENIAESSQWYGENYRTSLNADVFVFDYRGYGKSQGTPFEQGVLEDSKAALNLLCERTGREHSEIVIVGNSIGGGPAVYLAAEYGCKALILRRTFTRITDAAQANYPWLPVRMVMRNQYPSITRIKSYEGPLFQSHGDADSLIPFELGKELFEAAPTSNKKFFLVPGMGHLDPLPSEYWPEMAAFVDAIE